ncbi:hypothetical protein [Streptosporangium lutulentum]|uniref:Uncharacterized protein n=1 Tax=Streptosporangium lutulentum TaxID=1461250 RepID=A0ABT9QGV9_9ACTN|nr:hypothetical protein [Streptosporangium lutulentum]MDP9845997.1 hypothetical protein [Streptosporangium lutulentum]
MNSGFEANGETLEQRASQVHSYAAEYEAAVRRLRECGAESWGPDPVFSVLNKIWADCCHSMVEARGAASGVMYGTGDGIVRTSRNLEAADYASQIPGID